MSLLHTLIRREAQCLADLARAQEARRAAGLTGTIIGAPITAPSRAALHRTQEALAALRRSRQLFASAVSIRRHARKWDDDYAEQIARAQECRDEALAYLTMAQTLAQNDPLAQTS